MRDWLDKNAGDFSSIDDFRVSIDDFESPFEKQESEEIAMEECL